MVVVYIGTTPPSLLATVRVYTWSAHSEIIRTHHVVSASNTREHNGSVVNADSNHKQRSNENTVTYIYMAMKKNCQKTYQCIEISRYKKKKIQVQ